MKAYGRAPTFLMLTGCYQVRSIIADIAGDKEAAARVELVLPETGVCSRSPVDTAPGCCSEIPKQDQNVYCATVETAITQDNSVGRCKKARQTQDDRACCG